MSVVSTTPRSDVRLKTQQNSSKEKKIDVDLILKSVKSLATVSQEERKKQADKPLYLIRYE